MAPWIAAILTFLPMSSAETVAPGDGRMQLSIGLVAFGPAALNIGIVPLASGKAELAYGIVDGWDIRWRHETTMLASNRYGIDLHARAWHNRRWALGIHCFQSLQLNAVPLQQQFYYGGDISTEFALRASYKGVRPYAVTLETSVTLQWLTFDDGGGAVVDERPNLSRLLVAIEVEWLHRRAVNLSMRLQVEVVLSRTDPLSFFGTYPQVSWGGNWRL